MIVTLRDRAFTEQEMLSFILGEHGKAPWDFEFTVRATRENKFLDNCLYEDVIIICEGIRRNFVITKIETKVGTDESVYIVSGIDSASRILQNSFITHDLNITQSATDYIKKVLLTFTHISWNLNIESGLYLDRNLIKPAKAGDFLDSWFWSFVRKIKCYVYLEGNTIYFKTRGNARLAESYISVDRVKENYYNAYYVDVNNTYFSFLNPAKSNESIYYAPNLKKSLYTGSFQVDPYNGNTAADTSYWFDSCLEVADSNYDHTSQVSTYYLWDTAMGQNLALATKPGVTWGSGRYISFRHEKPTREMMEYLAQVLPVYKYVTRPGFPAGSIIIERTRITGEVVYYYGKYRIYYKDWLDSSDIVPNGAGGYAMGNGVYFGIETAYHVADITSVTPPVTVQALPFANDVKAMDLFLHSTTTGEVTFPENVYTSNYEFPSEVQRDMSIGDTIYSVSGEYEGTCLDRVISWEDSEVRYDVTIRDLVKLDVE